MKKVIEGKAQANTHIDIINDIINGGNFDFKDMNRYCEIKCISDRSEGTVDKSGIIY